MKITQEQQQKIQGFYQDVVSKSWESESFKQELIANPKATIKEFTGKEELPTNINVVVEDQSDKNIIYLNIPPKVNMDDFELNEEQLEAVAGGIVITGTVIAIVAVGSLIAGFGTAALLDKYF